MYPQYQIALIPANSFQGDGIEGWIGLCRRPYGEVYGVVKDEERATRFDSAEAAQQAIRRLPDALFDRYVPQVALIGADA